MTFSRENIVELTIQMREAAGALLAGRDGEFVDRVEKLAFTAKAAWRFPTRVLARGKE